MVVKEKRRSFVALVAVSVVAVVLALVGRQWTVALGIFPIVTVTVLAAWMAWREKA